MSAIDANSAVTDAVTTAAAPAAPVCFVHIPTTGGATLKDLLTSAYGTCANVGNWINDPVLAVAKLAKRAKSPALVLAAHMPYGAYRCHVPEGTRYITFLREPVDRVLSYYFRHMHGKKLGAKTQMTSIRDVDLARTELSNLATRFLCDDPAGELSAQSLAQAKRNLQGFAFVGLQERFDESVVRLQQVLALQDFVTYGVSRHVNPYRPSRDHISDSDRRAVLAHNALDAELYAYGRELFDRCAGASDENTAAQIERLHAMRAPVLAAHAAKRREAAEWCARALPPGSTRFHPELKAGAVAAGLDYEAFREEITAMHGEGRVVLLALDDGRRFLSSDSRFLRRRTTKLLFLNADESRALCAELERERFNG